MKSAGSNSPVNHPEHFERGRIANRFLNDCMAQYQATKQEPSLEESLLASYLAHHVRRRLRQYLLAGINGVDALGALIHSVVQLTFSVLLSQGRNELEDALNTRSHVNVLHTHALSSRAAELGRLELGRTSALGYAAADAGPTVNVGVEISSNQWVRLNEHAWTLPHFMHVLDMVVPIDFDFVLHFILRPSERGFCLATDKRERSMLGMTTMLDSPRSLTQSDGGTNG
jgi:hypothetical protein